MLDQKPKSGYVVPRNAAQGAPGFALPPQPQHVQPQRPQATPTPVEAQTPVAEQPPAPQFADEELLKHLHTPWFTDEELLLCLRMLCVTMRRHDEAAAKIAFAAVSKIEAALLARHANSPVPVNGERLTEAEREQIIAEARAAIPPIRPPSTPGAVPEIDLNGLHTGRYVLWAVPGEATEVVGQQLPKYFASGLFLFEGEPGQFWSYKPSFKVQYAEACRDHVGALAADPAIGRVQLPAEVIAEYPKYVAELQATVLAKQES